MINLKVKTLDSQTYDFSVDDEITVRDFKTTIAEKTNISADLQRIIYCGRVLVDEKLLKEYDVNGKVVHVVERAPPSSRAPSTNSTSTGESGRRNRDGQQMRGNPIFRALDGMVVGAMTIPVNGAGQNQNNMPSLNPSSSFCMNRITVARHMLDCANNIAAYLEDPDRGLNNSSLDIITRGSWTMESTVVEVGISAATNVDFSENNTQNMMEAFRGAVSAALRSNGHPNVTVLQLPTVFSSNGIADQAAPDGGSQVTGPSGSDTATSTPRARNEPNAPALPPPPIGAGSSDDQAEVSSEPTSAAAGAAATNTTTTSAQDTRNSSNTSAGNESRAAGGASNRSGSAARSRSRQRTGTRVLAEVVHTMRAVQTRLEPFMQQYHDILQADPQFDANGPSGRESAQRIFDRVSEALHYMSHAQHAISDLMLDLSQNSPRYLCCRPILVEQNGFVSSNNYLASYMNEGGNGNAPAPSTPQPSSAAAGSRSRDNAPPIPPRFSASQGANASRSSPATASVSTSTNSGPAAAENTSATSASTIPVIDPINITQTAMPVTISGPNGSYNSLLSEIMSSIRGAGQTITAQQQGSRSAARAATTTATTATTTTTATATATASATATANPYSITPDNSSNTSSATTPTAENSSDTATPPTGGVLPDGTFDPQGTLSTLTQFISSMRGDRQAAPMMSLPRGFAVVPNQQNIDVDNNGNNDEREPVAEIILNLGPRRRLPQNPQLQVARLIQAVVNSAPLDADLHVQINAPNLLSFGIPVQNTRSNSTGQSPAGQSAASTAASSSATQTGSTSSTSSGNDSDSNQPRVTTATHPTTSTQTRSTARPQVHIANVPTNWSARVIPANMLSSFDRFLPCSSHHIRETEGANDIPGNQGMQQNVMPNVFYRGRPQVRRSRPQANLSSAATRSNSASARIVGGGISIPGSGSILTQMQQVPPSSTGDSSRYSSVEDIRTLSNDEFNIPVNFFGTSLTMRDLVDVSPSPNLLNRVRPELVAFIVQHLFAGEPISETHLNRALTVLMRKMHDLLIYLPQFERPDYDARASVESYIRTALPCIIILISEDDSIEFGTRLLREMLIFIRRLFILLIICIGRTNTEIFINQVVQYVVTADSVLQVPADIQEPMRVLQRHMVSALTRQLNMTPERAMEIQEFLVIRRPDIPQPRASPPVETQPMETDDTTPRRSTAAPGAPTLLRTTMPIPIPIPNAEQPLPPVNIGTEAWHSNFPSTWLPIITRDIERQRRQTSDPPFSDAYITGMSAKRRKLVTSTKSPTEVPLLVADGVKNAIQLSGLQTQPSSESNNTNNGTANSSNSAGTSTTSSDEISLSIASDSLTQAAYCEALRASVQDRLKGDPNYVPEKFPNSSKYFSK